MKGLRSLWNIISAAEEPGFWKLQKEREYALARSFNAGNAHRKPLLDDEFMNHTKRWKVNLKAMDSSTIWRSIL